MYENYYPQDTNHAENRAVISETLQKMYESRLNSLESLLEKILFKVKDDKLLCAMADEEIESSYLILRAQEIIESQLNNQREKLIQELSQRLAEETNVEFYKRELENVKQLFESELNQMEQDLKKFKRKYEEKVNHNSQLLSENEKLLEQVTDKENRRESFHYSEISKYKLEMNNLQKHCRALEKLNEEFENELEENKRLLSIQKEEIAESKYDLKALDSIKKKYSSLQESFKQVQNENYELKERRQSERMVEDLQSSNEKLLKVISSLESKYESEMAQNSEIKKRQRVKDSEIKELQKKNSNIKRKLKSLIKGITPLKKQLLSLSQESLNFKSTFQRLLTKGQEKISAKLLHDEMYKNRQLDKAGNKIEELMQYLDISEGNEAALMKVNTKALWRIEELEKRLQLYEQEEEDYRYKFKPDLRRQTINLRNERRSVSWNLKSKIN